jgi:hypothetical protein
MSERTSPISPRLRQISDELFAFEGVDALAQAWRDGLTPDPSLNVSEWADRHRFLSPRASAEPGRYRTQTSLRSLRNSLTAPHALHARHHGCALAFASVAPHRVHEGGAGQGDRGRQQLDRLRHPSRAGPHARRPADGGTGQALLAPAHRSADRGKPGAPRAGQAAAFARRRQHGAVEGIPGGASGHHRRQQRGRPALHAVKFTQTAQVCLRRATCFSTRSMPIRLPPTRKAILSRSRRPGRAPSPGGRRFFSLQRRRSMACRGSSASSRPATSGATSCLARIAACRNGSSSTNSNG